MQCRHAKRQKMFMNQEWLYFQNFSTINCALWNIVLYTLWFELISQLLTRFQQSFCTFSNSQTRVDFKNVQNCIPTMKSDWDIACFVNDVRKKINEITVYLALFWNSKVVNQIAETLRCRFFFISSINVYCHFCVCVYAYIAENS